MSAVNIIRAAELCEQVLSVNLIPFLKSSPGMGKSKLIGSVFQKLNLYTIDHRISSSVPEDFSGLPNLSGKRAKFIPFDLFPLEDDVIPEGYDGWGLFLDEYNSGQTEVMAATYKLLLDRMINQTPLHTNVAIALAGNLDTDKAITNYVSSAIKSRVITIYMKSEYAAWRDVVGIPFNYDPRIMSYLENNPDHLNNFEKDPDADSYACERTWEFMNDLIKFHLPILSKPEQVDSLLTLFKCTIGPVASSFVAHIRNYSELIPIREILANPKEARVPSDHSLKYHTISNICQNVNERDFSKFCDYVERYSLNYQVIFFKTVMKRFPELRNQYTFRSHAIRIANYLHNKDADFNAYIR